VASQFNPAEWLRFVHLDLFESEWNDWDLDDDDLLDLQFLIMAKPDRGKVAPGSGGMRKVRFVDRRSSRGKSGAYRIGYAYFPAYGTVLLITVWGKHEKSDLSRSDYAAIAAMIREIQKQLDQEEI
jgi:hypothetical protein